MCTTVIVGKAVSKTGRVIVGHNEDSGGRVFHQQFFVPGGKHAAGEVLVAEPGRAEVPPPPAAEQRACAGQVLRLDGIVDKLPLLIWGAAVYRQPSNCTPLLHSSAAHNTARDADILSVHC